MKKIQTDCVPSLKEIDFRHDPPEGYRYEVIRKNASIVAIWTVYNPGFVYNDGGDIRCIWGFWSSKTRKYYAPINSNKVGEEVDIKDTSPYSAMKIRLNPLEKALFG